MQFRGPFLESSETFRTYFGLHNSLCIFKTKASRGTKPCIYFNFYSLYNIWKDRLHRISGSQFYEWLFGPGKFSGFSRNGPQVYRDLSLLSTMQANSTYRIKWSDTQFSCNPEKREQAEPGLHIIDTQLYLGCSCMSKTKTHATVRRQRIFLVTR